VKVTLLPDAMLALLDVRVVVETSGINAVIVTLIAAEVEDALLASPL